MVRFALGDYFLQITKERMLLITSYRLTRKKCCKCKGTIRVIGLVTLHPWENQHRLQVVTLKICSKHLLLHLRMREFQQEQASKQPRYNADLVSHRKADPWVWLPVCRLTPVGFPTGLGYICHCQADRFPINEGEMELHCYKILTFMLGGTIRGLSALK